MHDPAVELCVTCGIMFLAYLYDQWNIDRIPTPPNSQRTDSQSGSQSTKAAP